MKKKCGSSRKGHFFSPRAKEEELEHHEGSICARAWTASDFI